MMYSKFVKGYRCQAAKPEATSTAATTAAAADSQWTQPNHGGGSIPPLASRQGILQRQNIAEV